MNNAVWHRNNSYIRGGFIVTDVFIVCIAKAAVLAKPPTTHTAVVEEGAVVRATNSHLHHGEFANIDDGSGARSLVVTNRQRIAVACASIAS